MSTEASSHNPDEQEDDYETSDKQARHKPKKFRPKKLLRKLKRYVLKKPESRDKDLAPAAASSARSSLEQDQAETVVHSHDVADVEESDGREDDEEEIKRRQEIDDAATKIQSRLRGVHSRRKFKAGLGHARKVIREIASTETSYVANLNLLIEHYVQPLRWNATTSPNPMLSTTEIAQLFSNIDLIFQFNTTLLSSLKEKAVTSDGITLCHLGSIFKEMGPFMKLYIEYCNNYSNAMTLLHSLEADSSRNHLHMFVKTIRESTNDVGLDLRSLLIMPVQRIPRYVLLLKDLVKCCKSEVAFAKGVDGLGWYHDIVDATELVQSVADSVNESIRKAENMAKVISIQNSLVVPSDVREFWEDLVIPSRESVYEGKLICLQDQTSADNPSEWQDYHAFLLSDLLVLGKEIPSKEVDEKFEWRGSVRLSGDSSATKSWVKDVVDMKIIRNAFHLITPFLCCTFVCPTEDDKFEWIEEINKCIRSLSRTLEDREKYSAASSDSTMEVRKSYLATIDKAEIASPQPGSAERKSYAVYYVRVTSIHGEEWKVKRRFREFLLLRDAMIGHAKKTSGKVNRIPTLPKKKLRNNLSEATVEYRRVLLEAFLQQILFNYDIPQVWALQAFLQENAQPTSPTKNGNIFTRLKLHISRADSRASGGDSNDNDNDNDNGNDNDEDDGRRVTGDGDKTPPKPRRSSPSVLLTARTPRQSQPRNSRYLTVDVADDGEGSADDASWSSLSESYLSSSDSEPSEDQVQ